MAASLALMGDDHTCESSTTAHQSEFAFVDAMIPILNPAGVQEIVDYGLFGWALSRFAGVWTGIKCVKDNVESTGVIDGIARSRAAGHPGLPDRRQAGSTSGRAGTRWRRKSCCIAGSGRRCSPSSARTSSTAS